jgi:phosphatidylserine/phosphatidylglycerophosphate/cardiolipin synthase-like enzyme
MVADNATTIVGGPNIGDIFGVNTTANYRDLDVLAVGPSSATRLKQNGAPKGAVSSRSARSQLVG